MKITSTKKTEGDCNCPSPSPEHPCMCSCHPEQECLDCLCGRHKCRVCQPTEKPIIEELDQHYWAGYHNGRMDGKYQALAEYKQKLIQRLSEILDYWGKHPSELYELMNRGRI